MFVCLFFKEYQTLLWHKKSLVTVRIMHKLPSVLKLLQYMLCYCSFSINCGSEYELNYLNECFVRYQKLVVF